MEIYQKQIVVAMLQQLYQKNLRKYKTQENFIQVRPKFGSSYFLLSMALIDQNQEFNTDYKQ